MYMDIVHQIEVLVTLHGNTVLPSESALPPMYSLAVGVSFNIAFLNTFIERSER